MAWVERTSRNSWRVRYWQDDATLGSISGFATKSAADRHADDMEGERRAGTFIDPAAGKMTVEQWAEDWMPSIDVDIRTEENYASMLRCHILPRWGTTALGDISGIHVAGWAKTMRSNGLAPATVAGITKLFTMMLGDAVVERLIAYNPVQPRRRGRHRPVRPTERIWATPHEVLDIADIVARNYDPCGAVLIITAAWTGARWGELTGLHRNNLHLEDAVMIIDPDVGALHESGGGKLWLGPPKNAGSARTITLPPFLVALLQNHLATTHSEFVFTSPDGSWHRRSNFARRALRPAADGSKAPEVLEAKETGAIDEIKRGLTFHGLRHSHKTWMIADGVPEIAQARRLGHVLHDKIQNTYSHVAPEVDWRLLAALEDRWDKATANSTTDLARVTYREACLIRSGSSDSRPTR